ncbi:MAG: hypothetical protein ACYDEJ_03175 [Desulfitobacteriaceae bacterium]
MSTAPLATIVQVGDVNNNGNATDLYIWWTTASNQTNIAEYRIFVVPTVDASNFTVAVASAITNTTYYRVGTTYFGAGVNVGSLYGYNVPYPLDYEGSAIAEDIPYTVFILSVGSNGYDNALTSPAASLTLGTNANIPPPWYIYLTDDSNSGTAGDIKVQFSEPSNVTNTSGYKIFVVPTDDINLITFEFLGGLSSASYATSSKSGAYATHILNLPSNLLDVSGDAIIEGVPYSVVIQAVAISGVSSYIIKSSITLAQAISIAAVKATSSNLARVPVIGLSSNIQSVVAEVSNLAVSPTVSAIRNVSVVLPTAPAICTFVNPLVDVTAHVGIVAVLAVSSSSAEPPVITTLNSVEIFGVVALIDSAASSPTVDASRQIDIEAPTATLDNRAESPAVGIFIEILPPVSPLECFAGGPDVSAIRNTNIGSAITEVTTLANAPMISFSVPWVTIVDLLDADNHGNAGDIWFNIVTAFDETNISLYRFFIVPTSQASSFTIETASAITNTNYYRELYPVGATIGMVMNFLSYHLAYDGAAITPGVSYKVFALSIAKNGCNNSLICSSDEINLVVNAPPPFSSMITFLDWTNTHTASDFGIQFSDPVCITNTSEYRIYVVPTSEVDSISPELLAGLSSSQYITQTPTSVWYYHTKYLTPDFLDVNGNAVIEGVPYSVVIQAMAITGVSSYVIKGSWTLGLRADSMEATSLALAPNIGTNSPIIYLLAPTVATSQTLVPIVYSGHINVSVPKGMSTTLAKQPIIRVSTNSVVPIMPAESEGVQPEASSTQCPIIEILTMTAGSAAYAPDIVVEGPDVNISAAVAASNIEALAPLIELVFHLSINAVYTSSNSSMLPPVVNPGIGLEVIVPLILVSSLAKVPTIFAHIYSTTDFDEGFQVGLNLGFKLDTSKYFKYGIGDTISVNSLEYYNYYRLKIIS